MAITTRTKTTNSAEVSKGRYTQGGQVERYTNRLGWWERSTLSPSNSDVGYTVTARTALRPDLIAYDVYGTSELQWFVLQFNNIVDINEELTAGTRITLPTPDRLQNSGLNNSTGGVSV